MNFFSDIDGTVGKGVHISPGVVLLGRIDIGDDVFIAPNVTIRCDEPDSQIIIGDGCNIQDNVVIHSLKGSRVKMAEHCSIGHGAIVHGPCEIERGSFIGFGSVVFRCRIGRGSMIMHKVLVEDCDIPPDTLVPSGSIVKGRIEHLLPKIRPEDQRFNEYVIAMNLDLNRRYRSASDPYKIITN
ncbi:MAG: Carbonic anhydrase precursor [Methanomassiliicoccales archaeon PtaU1.Bin124]|nr:MAG: Carbonic anhydrase precursor [Methanomassiliicoccales archaeon PtaU1.Bin124]